jgi:predicted nucleic acid-binding protein
MSSSDERKILLDSDVIRNFIRGERPDLLPKIFPNRLVVLEQVHNEICRDIRIRKYLEIPIDEGLIEYLDFPYELDILIEYEKLKEIMDDGESACLAYAKFKDMSVASSNLKQITNYCEGNGIEILPTMEILLIAENKEILSAAECNDFIKLVIKNGGFLPCNTIEEYKKHHKLGPNK